MPALPRLPLGTEKSRSRTKHAELYKDKYGEYPDDGLTPEERQFKQDARKPNSVYAAAKKNIDAAKLAHDTWAARETLRLAMAPPMEHPAPDPGTFGGRVIQRYGDSDRSNIVDKRGEHDLPPVGDRFGTLAESLPASYPELEAYRARLHEIDASKDRQAGRPERPLPPSNVPKPALSTMTDEAVAQLRKELGMK